MGLWFINWGLGTRGIWHKGWKAVTEHGPVPLGRGKFDEDRWQLFHAVEDRHYVTDVHATVLHQLGLDPRKLEVPGRKRLEIDHGRPIKEIIA